MRRWLHYLSGGVLGALLGLGSALWGAGLWPAHDNLSFGNVNVGGWRSDFAIGSSAADPYTRARVARHGLLALAKTEAVYFTRFADDDGEPLREACRYRIGGGSMPAGWWSVTLYDARSMLPGNKDGALSIDAGRTGPGAWQAVITSERPADAAHWISSRNAGTFDLTLRLYMPEPALLADPAAVLEPPSITRLGCEGEDRG